MKTSNDIEWEENANYAMVNKLSGKVYQSNEMPHKHEFMKGTIEFDGLVFVEKSFYLVERKSLVVDEMEAAKQNQIAEFNEKIYNESPACKGHGLLMFMQENSMLAEIILPLKAKDNA